MLVCALLLSVVVARHVTHTAAAHRFALEDAPHRRVALVLGARVHGDRPSNMLEDRLAAALALYEAGRCDKLLLSGAHDRDDYDEVGVMRRWLEARGVPPDDIYLDHAGLRTLDSMVRAREVFGAGEVVVVTQDFHLARAIYLGRALGLDVVGVEAPPRYRYPRALHRRNAVREHLARSRAWLDVQVLGTRPKFGGPAVDLEHSGTATH